MQEEGFVAKLLYPSGTKDVELGKVIAILVENEEDVAAFADYVEGAEEPINTP
jgi:pyruvate dehydrogenase E2 component (dihydrolipoamide acetyltransferase)